MISRLVLVGVVGALGISVPTWPEIREWMGAAHSWTAYQLAAWDACSRSDADSITMAPTPRPLPVASGRDAARDSRRSDRPSPTFEPIVVDVRVWDLAYALNRNAEGLDRASGAMIARVRSSDETEKRSDVARRRGDLSPALVSDALELRLMAAVVQAAESADTPAAPIAERRCLASFAPIPCVFSRSLSTAKPATNDRMTASVPAPDPAALAQPMLGMRPVSDAMPGTGPELDCFAEPFDQPAPAVAVAIGSQPAFDPIDLAMDPGAGLADILNHVSDGLAVDLPASVLDDRDQSQPSPRPGPIAAPAAPVGAVPRPIPAPHVAQALRLTGEAVHAWMNVLAGPAIVQVSAR